MDPFLVIDLISRLMPLAIEVAWQNMWEQTEQERQHSQAVLQRHRLAPTSETLPALQAMRDRNRALTQSVIENRDELARMIGTYEATCAQLEQQAEKAAKRGDAGLAAQFRWAWDRYQEPLAWTRTSLEQAESILTQMEQKRARAEEQLSREEQRILDIACREGEPAIIVRF